MPRLSRTSALPSAPRPPWRWAALGLLVGALPALLVFAPARWLATGLARATSGQVQLVQARGTVWNGSAQLVLAGGAGSNDRASLPGRLAWELRPAWAGARARLNMDCCTAAPVQLQVTAGWGSAHLAVMDSQSHWPAAVLSGLGTPWNTVQPQGRLAVQTRGLQVAWAAGRSVLTGQIQVDALGVSSRLSTLRPMGSYRVSIQGGNAPTLTLSTLEGALLLSGSGQWVGQRLRFTGEATAAPDREAALANLLNIIGRRTGARSIITVG
ncbi:MAG: type II secretion system protein N [Comamonadaceae bacterium]|nr:MAG: type II secretion system protein N [Comamonadaceae bacterium]